MDRQLVIRFEEIAQAQSEEEMTALAMTFTVKELRTLWDFKAGYWDEQMLKGQISKMRKTDWAEAVVYLAKELKARREKEAVAVAVKSETEKREENTQEVSSQNMKSEYEVLIKQEEINFAPQTLDEEVLQNVITLCTTAKYSVPMDRELGVEAVFVDEPVNRARAKYTQEVIKAVRKFEPRAEVTQVSFTGDGDGKVFPRVRIRLKEG